MSRAALYLLGPPQIELNGQPLRIGRRKALALLAYVAVERERSGVVLPPVDEPHHQRALAATREGLGQAAFSAAWSRGENLTLDEAVQLALRL